MQPIDILKGEHEEILKNIDELEKILAKAKKSRSIDNIKAELKKLEHVAHVFEEAENHHKREEDVLFPRMEAAGIEGPTSVMRMEHDELRKRKRALESLAKKKAKISFSEFAKTLEENGRYIVDVLREHIFKENNILYPMAMEVIDEKEWPKVRKEFDKIGYCCFSPIGHKH